MATDTDAVKKLALVVDDDATMVEYVSTILRNAGYQVESAGDGMKALEMYRAGKFDAVVCDNRMPRLSGISFLMNLRLTPQSTCRVVLLSSMDDPAMRREVLATGAVAYLIKPASSKAILEAVTGVAVA
jgi:CheY-like chemotaxis protein